GLRPRVPARRRPAHPCRTPRPGAGPPRAQRRRGGGRRRRRGQRPGCLRPGRRARRAAPGGAAPSRRRRPGRRPSDRPGRRRAGSYPMTFGQVLLVAVLVVPAVGAVAVAATPRDRAARIIGTIAAALTLLAAVPLVFGGRGWFAWSAGTPAVRPWHQVDLPWVPGLDLRFHLGVDGISWPLVVLTALLTLLCCAYTVWRVPDG